MSRERLMWCKDCEESWWQSVFATNECPICHAEGVDYEEAGIKTDHEIYEEENPR